MNSDKLTPLSLQASPARARAWLRRLALLVLICWLAGWITHWVSQDARGHKAAFGRGLIHGAAMPLALPRLAWGHDVVIYASNNSGRSYNLAYTLGVNLCGALFFGSLFWNRRLSRIQ